MIDRVFDAFDRMFSESSIAAMARSGGAAAVRPAQLGDAWAR